MSVAPEINRQRPRYCWDRLEWMCHLSTNQSRALTESCWFPSARVMLDQATRPWLGIQQSLGISWLHAYTGRSSSTWWRWWIREYARKVQSTLAVKLPWSLSILQSWNMQKKRQTLESEQPVGRKYTRSASSLFLNNSGTCFFVWRVFYTYVSTFGLDARIRKCATALLDW